MRKTAALVRLDITRVLWRRRTLAFLALALIECWTCTRPTSGSFGGEPTEYSAAISDILPCFFNHTWLRFGTQDAILILLSVAVVVEERDSRAVWTIVHRAGGLRRWWQAKLLTAITLTTIVVSMAALMLIFCGILKGWHFTLGASTFSKTGEGEQLYSSGLHPLAQTGLIYGLSIIVALPLSMLAMVAAMFFRRAPVAFGVPFALLTFYWTVIYPAIPKPLHYRFDPFVQSEVIQHYVGFNYSWWYTVGTAGAWMASALAWAAFVPRRAEVTAA